MRRLIKIWIDDSLPLPAKVRNFPAMKHPLHQMLGVLKVGESFAWPNDLAGSRNNLQAVARHHEKRTGKKFKARTIKGTLNFWRTA